MEKVLEKFTIDDVEVGDVFLHKHNKSRFTVSEKHKDKGYILLKSYGALWALSFYYFDLIKKSNKTETQTEEQLIEQQPTSIKSVLSGIDKLLEYKESKYGNALNNDRLKVFSGKCKFGDILDAKLNRVANGEELLKNDVVDIAGYLILTLREKGWDDFSEFMD
jgi:hypothetical protein